VVGRADGFRDAETPAPSDRRFGVGHESHQKFLRLRCSERTDVVDQSFDLGDLE
jgi:hypothetical protein